MTILILAPSGLLSLEPFTAFVELPLKIRFPRDFAKGESLLARPLVTHEATVSIPIAADRRRAIVPGDAPCALILVLPASSIVVDVCIHG
jgi:hypothetical protein